MSTESTRTPQGCSPDAGAEWRLLNAWEGEDPSFTIRNPGWWRVLRLRRVIKDKDGTGQWTPMWYLEGKP